MTLPSNIFFKAVMADGEWVERPYERFTENGQLRDRPIELTAAQWGELRAREMLASLDKALADLREMHARQMADLRSATTNIRRSVDHMAGTAILQRTRS